MWLAWKWAPIMGDLRHVDELTELDMQLSHRIDKYKEALQWCGGSADFAQGGKAHKGWMKICDPLL